MSNNEQKSPPPPPLNMGNIVNSQNQMKPSFTTSAEIRLDQSMKMFLKGKRHYDKNEVDDAISALKSAVESLKSSELGADASTFYSYLGMAYLKKGWNSYAKAQFQQALNLNPKDNIALENIIIADGNAKPIKSSSSSEAKIVEEKGLIKKIKSIFIRKT